MKSPPDLSRLLIIRNDRIGDLVLTLPAFEYARKAYPNAEISVLVAEGTAPLLQKNANVDRVLTDDGKSSSKELARRLRPQRFHATVVINTNTRNCLAVWRARIPIRVCWAGKPIGLLLGNHRVRLRRSHPPIHESEFALALVKRLGIDPSVMLSPPSLHMDEVVRQRVRARIQGDLGRDGPLFGVHPGNYNSAYNWPPERYLELVRYLASRGRVAVTGGPGERALLAAMKAELPHTALPRVAFYSDFELQEACAAIAMEDVLTVSSTGPMHLAGALGTPVVALFSAHPAHDPKKWAPFGNENTILQPPLLDGESAEIPREQAHEHMCRISLEDVIRANLRHVTSPRCRQSA